MDVAEELGFEPIVRHPEGLRGFRPVAACSRQLASVDVVLLILGNRRGEVPSPQEGGDGSHPWSWWEAQAAFEFGLPTAVLMAAPDGSLAGVEEDPLGRAVMRDFRGELGRLATLFDGDPGPGFRRCVQAALMAKAPASSSSLQASLGAFEVPFHRRRWPQPSLPKHPYPLLLPYTHPDLMSGRGQEIEEVQRLLAGPVPILGLHAPSGTGKSSFLDGGLVPALRAADRAVAVDRHPWEPGIVRRLLSGLIDEGEPARVDDADPSIFVDRLRLLRHQAGSPPILVVDQFEGVLQPGSRQVRGHLGRLLAASVQRFPGQAVAICRWLLAYRQEFHGEVFQWLTDVLRDARDQDTTWWGPLPHDLSSPDRFQAWALSPLGTPAPGTMDLASAATRVFQAAIEKPLTLVERRRELEEPVYPLRFVGDGALRLARAFGEARAANRKAPLVPELQVVLSHLLDTSLRSDGDGVQLVEVPEDPGQLIDRALEEHLRRSLDNAFPVGRKGLGVLGRTRALLALRQLADVHGQREEGKAVQALVRVIGPGGHEILESLSTPRTRVVLRELRGDDQVYVLSHDRLAEVIVQLVDGEGASEGFGVAPELLKLRRFIMLQRELFNVGEVEQSTEVPERTFKKIDLHRDALLWDEEERSWWEACQARRRRDRHHQGLYRGAAALLLIGLVFLISIPILRLFERQTLLDQVSSGDPDLAFVALASLSADPEEDDQALVDELGKRANPFDLLESGLAGIPHEAGRGGALLRTVELLLPRIREVSEDPVRLGTTIWALDFFARSEDPSSDPRLRERALALRDEILEPLRGRHPPPPRPGVSDPGWVHVPAGRFLMGGEPREIGDEGALVEWPRHEVSLSAFRLMTHEVTAEEYRRLVPQHRPTDAPEVPAVEVTWYEAYTYAAWLGGRLPTEAEWEYAARADCAFDFCGGDGNRVSAGEVAWWAGNSRDPESREPIAQPVGRLEPNPWGLYDMYGNVFEWVANWARPYSEADQVDPPGLPAPPAMGRFRAFRGGSALFGLEWISPARRQRFPATAYRQHVGFRVLLPHPSGVPN